MAVVDQVILNGVVRATWDDATERYKEFATDGVTVTIDRAYTPVELGQKAERTARAQQQQNYATTRAQIEGGIAALQADIATLQAGAALSDAQAAAQIGPNFKALCNIVIRLENSTIGLARIVSGALS